MFSVFGILLLLNYSTTNAYGENDNNYEELYHRTDKYLTIRERNDDGMRILKNQSLRAADPKTLFRTSCITNGSAEEDISFPLKFELRLDSFSGFFTTNNATGANLFWWYFPCLKNDTDVPLIVWLESGSKYPSSSRVFDTVGPYTVVAGKIRPNENTLLNDFNMLYIDSPVGVGFSYTRDPKGYSRTFYDAAKDVIEALKQFAKLFPQSMQNGVYLNGGDTHMSRIALHSALQIHYTNESSGIRVEGLMIGNGFLDPINMVGMSDLLYRIGVADEFTREYLLSLEEEIKRLLRSGQRGNAYKKYQNLVAKVNQLGYEQIYDFTSMTADNSYDSKILEIFSNVEIRELLQVGYLSYTDFKEPLNYIQQDLFTSMSSIISNLIPRMKFLFYVGQYGIKVNAARTYDFLRSLTWSGALAFHQLGFVNWCLKDDIVGYYKANGNLTYFVMRNIGNANHLVDPTLLISMWKRLTDSDIEDESEQRLMICSP